MSHQSSPRRLTVVDGTRPGPHLGLGATSGPRRVLVTGVMTDTGRALTRLLVERGLQVVGVDRSGALADGHVAALPGGLTAVPSPAPTEPSYVPFLVRVVRETGVDAVVPGGGLADLAAITTGQSLLGAAGVSVVGATPSAVAAAGDALATAARLAARGVLVPDFSSPSDHVDVASALARYPRGFVLRPRVTGTEEGVRLVTVADAVDWDAVDDTTMLHDFVPGRLVRVLLNRPSEGSVGKVTKVIDTGWSPGATSSPRAAGGTISDRDVEALERCSLAATRALGITGPAHVRLAHEEGRRPVVVDVSAGFDAHIASAPQVVDAVLGALSRRG